MTPFSRLAEHTLNAWQSQRFVSATKNIFNLTTIKKLITKFTSGNWASTTLTFATVRNWSTEMHTKSANLSMVRAGQMTFSVYLCVGFIAIVVHLCWWHLHCFEPLSWKRKLSHEICCFHWKNSRWFCSACEENKEKPLTHCYKVDKIQSSSNPGFVILHINTGAPFISIVQIEASKWSTNSKHVSSAACTQQNAERSKKHNKKKDQDLQQPLPKKTWTMKKNKRLSDELMKTPS